MKKGLRITILLVIVIAVVICLVINVNSRNNISREKISELINKGVSYTNVYCEYTVEGDKYIYHRLDNIVTLETDAQCIWIDFDKNENFLIQKENKKIYIQSNEETNIMENKEYHDYANIIDNDEYEYEFLEKEEYNNRKCYLVGLKNNVDDCNMTIKLWIDSNTGLLLKEYTDMITDGEENKEEIDYDVTLGTVTADEVVKPNVNNNYPNYEIIQYKNN